VGCFADSSIGVGVRVLVVPKVESEGQFAFEALVLSDETLLRVAKYIDAHRVVGTRVIIEPPVYQAVTVVAQIRSRRTSPDVLRSRALDALYRYFHPVVGGPDGSGWPFGGTVTLDDVYEILRAVPGVKAVEEARLFPADPLTGERGEDVHSIELSGARLVFSYAHEVIVSTK